MIQQRFKVSPFCQPQDVVDTHDTLRLRVAATVNDGALGLHPHKASMLG